VQAATTGDVRAVDETTWFAKHYESINGGPDKPKINGLRAWSKGLARRLKSTRFWVDRPVHTYADKAPALGNAAQPESGWPQRSLAGAIGAVDPRRFELLTSSMRTRRATNCAKGPLTA
jgi:hypothetical protein